MQPIKATKPIDVDPNSATAPSSWKDPAKTEARIEDNRAKIILANLEAQTKYDSDIASQRAQFQSDNYVLRSALTLN